MNTIFKYTGDKLSEDEEGTLHELGVEYVSQIPEMKEGFIQADTGYPQPFESIKAFLETKGTVEVIGVWQDNGLQYGYKKIIIDSDSEQIETVVRDNDIDIKYPFDITKYRNGLLDIIESDNEDGTSNNRKHTIEEARDTQVNIFSGMLKRDLVSY